MKKIKWIWVFLFVLPIVGVAQTMEECRTIDNTDIPETVWSWFEDIITRVDQVSTQPDIEELMADIDRYKVVKDEAPFLVPEEMDSRMAVCLNTARGILHDRLIAGVPGTEEPEAPIESPAEEMATPGEDIEITSESQDPRPVLTEAGSVQPVELEITMAEPEPVVPAAVEEEETLVQPPVIVEEPVADETIFENDNIEIEPIAEDTQDEEVPVRTATIDTGTGALPVDPVPVMSMPKENLTFRSVPNDDEVELGISSKADRTAAPRQISPDVIQNVEERIADAVSRNDSLMEYLEGLRDTVYLSRAAVFDSMVKYQEKIYASIERIDALKRDSLGLSREIIALTDSMEIYQRRVDGLILENVGLWETIENILSEKKMLNSRIIALNDTISRLRQELKIKESEIANTAPYSKADSYFGIIANGMARMPLDLYNYDGDFGFGGIGVNFRKNNLFGQYSFRKVELDFYANMYETRKEADIHAAGGLWMYPWMLPWVSEISPTAEMIIDSTDFYIAGDFYTKSYVPPLTDDDESMFSITWGGKTYIPDIQTGFQLLSTSFEEDYEFRSYALGVQYRVYQSQIRQKNQTAQQIKQEQGRDPILFNLELFCAYRENYMLPSTFSDGFQYSGFQSPDYDKFLGVGITWGGNKYSYLPNLHNRLARNARFDIMDIFPIQLDNKQMFGLYTYMEFRDDGKVERMAGDAIYHLPAVPLFDCPALFRIGIHDNGTGRWLERTVSNSLAPTGYTGLNPLEPSPDNIIEADIWLMFDRVPFGILLRSTNPADEFPLEVGINTFFNLN